MRKKCAERKTPIREIYGFLAVLLLMTAVLISVPGCQKMIEVKAETSVKELTSENDLRKEYDEFVKNIQHYNLIGVEQTIDLTNVYVDDHQLDFHQDMRMLKLDQNGKVTVTLTGRLADQYGDNYVIDQHVLKMYTPHIGNGSWGQILFIKEDGSIDAVLYTDLNSEKLYIVENLGSVKYVKDILTSYFSLYAFDIRGYMTNLDLYLIEARDKISDL